MPRTRLRLVFAGTPGFAVPGLHACLDAGAEVAVVFTQPDRPAGRGRRLTLSPVKHAALDAGIAVEQPGSLQPAAVQQRLADYAPDLVVVIAYGLILPPAVLAIPRLGCWNVHASLLPRWRGAAPIQRAILAGDGETGVCLMRMQAGLDTGPVLLCASTAITTGDTGGSLHDRLSALGAEVLRKGLARVAAGETLSGSPQSDRGVTYARKLDKREAWLDFSTTALELERKVRAFDPWPVAECELAGERVRVWKAEARDSPPEDDTPSPFALSPRGEGNARSRAARDDLLNEAGTRDSEEHGEIVASSKHGIDVVCGEGVLRILKLQRAGGRVISAADYLNARQELRR